MGASRGYQLRPQDGRETLTLPPLPPGILRASTGPQPPHPRGPVQPTTEWISELEYKKVEITAREQNNEKRMKRIEDSLRDLWDNVKCPKIRIIGVSEEEEKKKGTEKIFEEVIVENYPKMGKEIVN